MTKLKHATLASKTLKHRLMIRIGGQPKVGKNHFSFTAPGPIAFHNWNNRVEHVIDKFIDEKEIWVYDYKTTTDNVLPVAASTKQRKAYQEAEQAIWKEQFEIARENIYESISNPEIRTIIFDTEGELWECRRLAQWGRQASIPEQFTALNKDMRDIYEAIRESDKNLIAISEMKKRYTKSVDERGREVSSWDGESYVMSGWSNVSYKVDMNLQAQFNSDNKEFSVKVLDCGLDPELTGDVYEGELCNFPQLAMMVFPNTADEEDYWVFLSELHTTHL